jgi:multiple RNA-binding domain-containing protein 1
VTDGALIQCRETKRSKGIAYVKFQVPEDALAALRALDMTPFQGRLMHVLPAQRSPGEAAAAAKQEEQEHEKVRIMSGM